jgi:GT2 family glycosyltransferase
VIIAAYQAAETIGAAVGSALEQSVPPREVVVCDDGSTDDLEGALAPYRDRIALLRKENGGAASAWNMAARAASSEFVVTLDADDVYLPERVEALGELASSRPDLDILTTDAYIELDRRRLGRYYRDPSDFVVEDQRTGIINGDFVFGSAAIRRERLLEIGGFDESLPCAEDRDCWLRLILSGSRAGLVAEPLLVYRLRRGSLSADRVLNLRTAIAILERARSQFELSPHEEALLTRCVRAMDEDIRLSEAEAAIKSGDAEARRRALAIARSRDFRASTRLKSALSAVAPRLAGLYLRRRRKQPRQPRLTQPRDG